MKKIIIIEDDPAIRDSAELMFTEMNYEVTTLLDGSFVISGLFDPPDIFLIDKQLSGVDGLEICSYLKTLEATKDIPVIMMSANPDAHRMALSAGAEAFIEKPYTLKEMKGLVRKHIRQRK
jgi:DNA-binding response OmpR family regulator